MRIERSILTTQITGYQPTFYVHQLAAHAAAYIAQTGRSVGLELVAHRVVTLRYECVRPEHGYVVLLRKVGADPTSTVEADKLPSAYHRVQTGNLCRSWNRNRKRR